MRAGDRSFDFAGKWISASVERDTGVFMDACLGVETRSYSGACERVGKHYIGDSFTAILPVVTARRRLYRRFTSSVG